MREQREQQQELGKTKNDQQQEPKLKGEGPMSTQTEDAATGSAARDASRELDALIAEKVMGWSQFPYIVFHASDSGIVQQWGATVVTLHHCPPGAVHVSTITRVPEYSTDIAAAWLVVERLTEQGMDTIVTSLSPVGAEVTIWRKNPHRPSYAAAEAAPLAICRAALLVVGAA